MHGNQAAVVKFHCFQYAQIRLVFEVKSKDTAMHKGTINQRATDGPKWLIYLWGLPHCMIADKLSHTLPSNAWGRNRLRGMGSIVIQLGLT